MKDNGKKEKGKMEVNSRMKVLTAELATQLLLRAWK